MHFCRAEGRVSEDHSSVESEEYIVQHAEYQCTLHIVLVNDQWSLCGSKFSESSPKQRLDRVTAILIEGGDEEASAFDSELLQRVVPSKSVHAHLKYKTKRIHEVIGTMR